MQIINLTHAEAADPAVVDTVLRLTGSGLTMIDTTSGEILGKQVIPSRGTIAPMDRPDAGVDVAPLVPFVPPVGAVPAAPVVVDTAALFGGQAAASAVPLAPAATPPSAAIAPTVVLSAVAAVPGGAATANAPTSIPGVEKDSTGLPWDARIHAGNKATKQDGSWKVKKGINDPSFIPRIEAELRAAMAAPGVAPAPAAAVPAAAPVPAVPVAPVAVPATVAVPVTGAVPLPPTATVSPPPSTPAPAASVAPIASPSSAPVLNFGSFMAKIAPYMANGKLTTEKQNEILSQFGLTTGFGGLMARPDLLPGVDATFAAVLPTL